MINSNSRYITAFEDWEAQKEFFCFTAEDAEYLKQLHPLAVAYTPEVVDQLFEHLMGYEEARTFVKDEQILERIKKGQNKYFLELTLGEYGKAYFDRRVEVGITHQRLGLPPRLYMGAYSKYLQLVTPKIYMHDGFNPEQANNIFLALSKITNLDQELTVSSYIHSVDEVISRQTEEILEMSTPIIQIWEGIVAAPIIGTLDSGRSQEFMERILEAIVETNSSIALVDITGVPQIDTATAQHLIDTINAVNLLGSQVIITGVRPAIAQTLVHLGIDLSGLITRPSMSSGLRVALSKLSLQVVPLAKS